MFLAKYLLESKKVEENILKTNENIDDKDYR